MPACVRHPFETALARCDRCADGLCSTCWVEAKGRLLCVDCALAEGGVRSTGRSARNAAALRRRINEHYHGDTELEWDEIDLREWRDRRRAASQGDVSPLAAQRRDD